MNTIDFNEFNFKFTELNCFNNFSEITFNPHYFGHIIFNKTTDDYFIIIPEHGMYSILFKCNLSIPFCHINDWSNIDDDYGHLIDMYFVKRKNPSIVHNIIIQLYELKSNPLCSLLINRIDTLILERISLTETNTNLAEFAKSSLGDICQE